MSIKKIVLENKKMIIGIAIIVIIGIILTITSNTKDNTKIYIGKCAPILLNPSLMITLQKIFNIKEITISKSIFFILFS